MISFLTIVRLVVRLWQDSGKFSDMDWFRDQAMLLMMISIIKVPGALYRERNGKITSSMVRFIYCSEFADKVWFRDRGTLLMMMMTHTAKHSHINTHHWNLFSEKKKFDFF